jgi:hypothetical protein
MLHGEDAEERLVDLVRGAVSGAFLCELLHRAAPVARTTPSVGCVDHGSEPIYRFEALSANVSCSLSGPYRRRLPGA